MSTPITGGAASLLLEARGIQRRFGGFVVWQNLDLAISEGEVVLLAGPNGAGKTTLLRCLAGLARPTKGRVQVSGDDLYEVASARAHLGFLAHDSFLYHDLTARENLHFAAAMQQLPSVPAVVEQALVIADLVTQADRRVDRFSRGMVQRLAIARALLHSPRLLLLDEPFTGLDSAATNRFQARLHAEQTRRCGIVCVTHEPAELWDLLTRVVVLVGKSVVWDAPRPASITEFRSRYAGLVA